MLPKKERLTRTEFERFFSSGRRYHNEYFTLVHTPDPVFRAAVAVPQKLTKKAVVRNKLRRQVYEIFRRMDGVREGGGVYIIIVKKPSLNAPLPIMREQLISLVKRVRPLL